MDLSCSSKIENENENENETGTFHSIYRKHSERALYLALCKQRLLCPSIETTNSVAFIEWLTPSWYISNGYFEDELESQFLSWMLAKHGVENTIILNKILHSLRFISLFVPRDVQEELLKWISE